MTKFVKRIATSKRNAREHWSDFFTAEDYELVSKHVEDNGIDVDGMNNQDFLDMINKTKLSGSTIKLRAPIGTRKSARLAKMAKHPD